MSRSVSLILSEAPIASGGSNALTTAVLSLFDLFARIIWIVCSTYMCPRTRDQAPNQPPTCVKLPIQVPLKQINEDEAAHLQWRYLCDHFGKRSGRSMNLRFGELWPLSRLLVRLALMQLVTLKFQQIVHASLYGARQSKNESQTPP